MEEGGQRGKELNSAPDQNPPTAYNVLECNLVFLPARVYGRPPGLGCLSGRGLGPAGCCEGP